MSLEPASESEIGLPEALELAIRAQQHGQIDQAAEIYRRILEVWPDCPDALHFSGLLAFKNGRHEQALALIEKSLALAPEHPGFWNNFGNVLKEIGDKSRATAAYQQAIALHSEFADAHNNLGVMASQVGDFTTAVHSYQRAISIDATHADAFLNLGNALDELQLLEEAVEAYKVRIDLRPADPDAYGRLGHIYWQQGKKEEAVEAITSHTKLDPGDPMAFLCLASIFSQQGRDEEAIGAFRKTVEISPCHSSGNRLLGLALARAGRNDESREVWKKWAEADPENPVPRHLLQVGSDEEIPERANDEFVVREFDRFADTFDAQLQHLQYRAPELVALALKRYLPRPDAQHDMLDAGCGTGLCGPLLRPWARHLEGVDLSPGMLDKARTRGGYDRLVAAELTAFLNATNEAYDVVVSADTLCYFGRLEEVVAAVAKALRAKGFFVFTVEKTPESTSAVKVTLDPSGRYTHTEAYVRSALTQAGLSVLEVTSTSLRMEYFKPVEGLLVVARK